MSRTYRGKYRTLLGHSKEYLNTRYDMLRLELLEKISSVVALLVLVMVALLLIGTVWIYLSGILVVLMERAFGSIIPALCVMGVFSVLILGLVFLLKNQLILNPLVRQFSKILFDDFVAFDNDDDDDDEEQDEEDDDEQQIK